VIGWRRQEGLPNLSTISARRLRAEQEGEHVDR
jgi:hypothetical protein